MAHLLGWRLHTAVDLLTDVIRIGRGPLFHSPPLPTSPPLAVAADALEFLLSSAGSSSSWAVVIHDLFLGGRHSSHMYTRAAFESIHFNLVLVVNVVSLPSAIFPRRLFETLRLVFGPLIRVAVDSNPNEGFSHPPNVMFFVARSPDVLSQLSLQWEVTLENLDHLEPFEDAQQVANLQDGIAESFDATFRRLVPPGLAKEMR